MKPVKSLPFVLVLGLAAGSTAAYAQAVDLDANVDTGVQLEPLPGAAATSPAICAEGDTACLDAQANADAELDIRTPDTGVAAESGVDPVTPGAGADTGVAADSGLDVITPDASATAEADGSLAPMDGDSTLTTSTQAAATLGDDERLTDLSTLASTEDLVGARVYDANAERIGSVSAVLPAENGSDSERIVIGMGGFLGLGQTPVAVSASEVQAAVNGDGEVQHIVVSHTREQLEAMPEVEM